MKSWKTTVSGILVALSALATGAAAFLDGDPETVVDIDLMLGALMQIAVAAGLVSARDNNVTSEASGAKRAEMRSSSRSALGLILILAVSLAAGGCATSGVQMTERTFNEDGTQASELQFTQSTRSTWGSTQEEGAGEMAYSADSMEKWKLAIGANAKGQQAGEPIESLRALLDLGTMLTNLVSNPSASPAEAAATPTPDTP